MKSLIQSLLRIIRGYDRRNLPNKQWGLTTELPTTWKERVHESHRSEELAKAIASSLSTDYKPYLNQLLMRDTYPSSISQFQELSRFYRNYVTTMHYRDAVGAEEYRNTINFGLRFENDLQRIFDAAKTQQEGQHGSDA